MATPNVKEIPLTDVKIGMCLAESVKNKSGEEIYKAHFYFTSREQIINLLDNGIKAVKVDLQLSLAEYSEKPATGRRSRIIEKELSESETRFARVAELLPEIKEVFDSSEKVVQECMLAVRYGGALDKKSIARESKKILQIIQMDPQISFALLDLKNFDEYTYIHSINVAVLSLAFAIALKYPDERLLSLAQGSILHDIGKAKIPVEILNKPNALNEKEIKIMQTHPVLGVQAIQNDKFADEIVEEIVYYHHENFDGSGYPKRFSGGQMKRYASIVSIADFYDALTAKRVYKEPIVPHEAMKSIYKESGIKFDPRIVHHFIRTVGIYPIGSLVELSDGRIATVISFSNERLLEPTVRVLFYKKFPQRKSNDIISLTGSGLYIKGIYKDVDLRTIDIFNPDKKANP